MNSFLDMRWNASQLYVQLSMHLRKCYPRTCLLPVSLCICEASLSSGNISDFKLKGLSIFGGIVPDKLGSLLVSKPNHRSDQPGTFHPMPDKMQNALGYLSFNQPPYLKTVYSSLCNLEARLHCVS